MKDEQPVLYRADEPAPPYRPQSLNERLDMIERRLSGIETKVESQDDRMWKLELRIVGILGVLTVLANAAAAFIRS